MIDNKTELKSKYMELREKYNQIYPQGDFEPMPNRKWNEPITITLPDNCKASDRQVSGSHYKNLAIQPGEYCQRNGLGAMESFVVKYVSRHKAKNGRQDIEKAIHCLELLLEWEYNTATNDS